MKTRQENYMLNTELEHNISNTESLLRITQA